MMPATAALGLFPFAMAISVWVSWSDMKFMKIPNKAVLALAATWLVVGILVLPWQVWAWGWALCAIILVLGMACNAAGLIGAGDAKFAAAMAPFFVTGDLRFVLGLFSACLLGAFVAHRIMRAWPAFRRATPDWASWTHKDFPMGLALSGTLSFYLLASILVGLGFFTVS